MNKRLMLIGAALLLTATTASAQKHVTGRVVDSEGQPVAGAAVKVEGHKGVTLTDANGKFSLNDVPASAKKLNVSSIGKVSQSVSIAGNVVVTLTDNTLGEAYVVAYGKATKAAFTGAAVKVDGATIENKATTEVTSALLGEVAGVQIIQSDGNPGSASAIRIRGIGSVNASAEPLIVVDGMPYGGSFSSIDPKDIESIDVMKDATASALYGSRGANGVVIITTKKGAKGKLSVGADIKYSVSGRWLPTYDVIKSPERFTELTWEGLRNYFVKNYGFTNEEAAPYASNYLFSRSGITADYNMWNAEGSALINPETGRFNEGITRKYNPESWEDELFRTGHRVDGSVNLTGGTDRVTFYTSLGYVQDKGYVVGADFRRFSTRTNIDAQIATWLKGSVNVAYSNLRSNASVQDDGAANNAISFSYNAPYLFPVFEHDAEGNRVIDENVGGYRYDYNLSRNYASGINPAGVANLDVNRTDVDQFNGNGQLEASFLTDFKFTAGLGYMFYNAKNNTLTNPYYGDAEGLGRTYNTFSTVRNVTGNQILRWGHLYGVHNVSAFVGHESTWYKREYTYGAKNNLVRANDGTFGNAVVYSSLTGYNTGYSLDSWFGQISYDYDNKYFFNASLRADGSSRFAKGHRWGTFGAVSAAWNMKKEQFLADVEWIHALKLKASWGLTGNQSLSTSTLGSVAAYYPYADFYTINNMNDNPSILFDYKGNKNLTWEKASNWNVGLEFDIAGRVEGEIDYFNKLTSDMLFLKSVPTSQGYPSVPVNDGKMRNSGVEFNVVAHIVKTKDVRFDFRLNGAHYKTTIVELPMDEVAGKRQDYYTYSTRYTWVKGKSMLAFYMPTYMGVDAQTGYSLWKKVTATFADGSTQDISNMELFKSQHAGEQYTLTESTTDSWSSATSDFTGDTALPKLQGGFGFDLSVKDFDFGITFTYALGGKAYDYNYASLMGDNSAGSNNWHKDIEKRWQNAGDVTDVPLLTNGTTKGSYANARSTRFLTSRSYLQLSNVHAAYNLPARWTERVGGMHGVQIYANAENLFLLSARKGFMPGTSLTGASTDTQYLPSSSFTIGLKLNF